MPSRKMQIPLSKWNICFLCIGGILGIGGVIILLCTNSIHEAILNIVLTFKPGSTVYEAWQKPPDPIVMNIYFFNWTNPEEISNPNVKPKFVEVGPYRYLHTKEKTDLVWNELNNSVTYTYLKHFYFDEKKSPMHHSDIITTINSIPLSIANIANDWHLMVQSVISSPVKNSEVYISKNVSELLFGYEDPVLSKVNSIPIFTNTKKNKYGFFYGRNGTIGSDGVFNMGTKGEEFGNIQNWNYKNRTDFYKEHCGEIYGSAGEMYPRNMQPTYMYLFSSEMCKTGRLNFVQNITVKGVHGYKFSPGIELFDNGSIVEDNYCFDNSLPSGILNVSACKEDAPAYLSLPHFYFADPSYVNAVEGLEPEKQKHELYIAVEPKTGVIIDLSARLQVNLLLQPLAGFGKFAELPNLMFPVFWFEQIVIASDELASNLNLLLGLPLIIEIGSLVITSLGILCIILVLLYVSCYKMKNQKEKKIRKEEIPLNSKS